MIEHERPGAPGRDPAAGPPPLVEQHHLRAARLPEPRRTGEPRHPGADDRDTHPPTLPGGSGAATPPRVAGAARILQTRAMTDPDEPPALAYVEHTLAQSYRHEIDQEENVWRSLPFFAATLALQLAALVQIIDKLPDPATPLGGLSLAALALAAAATLVSLCYLAASIYPQRFDYVARESDLLRYADALMAEERDPRNRAAEAPVSALVTLKTELARQYAQAAEHNRRINRRRERRRSVAGLAALVSVLMTVFLVGTTSAPYIFPRPVPEPAHAAPRPARLPAPR